MRQLTYADGENNVFAYLKELGYEKLTKRNGEPIVQVDEETWDHFIGCVPPIAWQRNCGVEVFCVGECTSGDMGGDIYLQLAKLWVVNKYHYYMRHAYPRNQLSWMTDTEILAAELTEPAAND